MFAPNTKSDTPDVLLRESGSPAQSLPTTVYVDTLVLGRKFHMWAKLLKKGFGFWEIKGKVFQFGKSGRLLVQLYYCPFKKFFDCIHGVTSQI